MKSLHTLAKLHNKILSENNNNLFHVLSQKGKAAYFPKFGILSQSADAAHASVNATIGIALEDDRQPMRLSALADAIQLQPKDIFPYTPSYGKAELRTKWLELIRVKNPSFHTDASMPVVTAGLTHALSIVGQLFLDPDDHLILPTPYWDNYELIFEEAHGAKLDAFSLYDGDGFNQRGLEEKLMDQKGKQVLFLNFPNNPTGYTPTIAEAENIVRAIQDSVKRGNTVVVIIDDAYFGLVYEEGILKESLFGHLADIHESVLAVKIDGATKEEYAWGLRIGFVTFASKGLQPDGLKALEDKTAGMVRGSVSNCSHPAQSLLLKALQSSTYNQEKEVHIHLLQERFRLSRELLAHPDYASQFTMLPSNSGYFLCLQLRDGLDAEVVRQKLLADYSTGVIAMSNLIRVAFSSVPLQDLPILYENIYKACKDL